ncbi:MAG: enoyl-CoA hydratase-related protein [Trueperaceae bacterium]
MSVILSKDDGAVRVLTLNRPEVRNALSLELRRRLAEALDEAAGDRRVRAVVMTGSGSAFCAGMDLDELGSVLNGSFEEHLADSRELGELFLRVFAFPKPLVAAVNGHAVAGGAGLASLCDIVVVSEGARLGYSEVRIGFVAALVSVFLSRLAGERVTRELLLEARLIDAREAVARGLASEALPAGEVLGRAMERARSMAENAPEAVSETKRLLVRTSGLPLTEALELAATVNARARSSEELREGVAAFLEKRAPAWQAHGELDQRDD